jgi:hypothetical protein
MARCKKQMQDNLDATKRGDFILRMSTEIMHKKPTHIRIHPSGDFYSQAYFLLWVGIAKVFPDVIFYGYTKSIPLVKQFELPENMILMYSYGGKADNEIQRSKDKHCIVIENKDYENALIEGYEIGNDDDLLMLSKHAVAFLKH